MILDGRMSRIKDNGKIKMGRLKQVPALFILLGFHAEKWSAGEVWTLECCMMDG